jgi:hypothetical protein
MKPSRNLQYRVKNLHFDNILVFLIKNQDAYLRDVEMKSLKDVNRMYQEMINNILQLRSIHLSMLKLPRFDYAHQTKISLNRVDLATACAIYYGLNTGMVVWYLKGKYVGESRNANAILIKRYRPTSVMRIASTSSISLTKDAHLTSILKRIMRTSI